MKSSQKYTWKSKNGLLSMFDMDEEHIQKALINAEQRFMHNHNEMMKSHHIACVFERKMKELREVARQRGIEVKSLSDMSEGKKYEIIRNTYSLAEKAGDS